MHEVILAFDERNNQISKERDSKQVSECGQGESLINLSQKRV